MEGNYLNLKDLELLAKTIHSQNVEKGFWEKVNSDDKQVCLIISELMEALEGDRKNRRANLKELERCVSNGENWNEVFERVVKNSIEDELADTWIRIVDWHYYSKIQRPKEVPQFNVTEIDYNFKKEFCSEILGIVRLVISLPDDDDIFNLLRLVVEKFSYALGVELRTHIELKIKYNATRAKYHNKKY